MSSGLNRYFSTLGLSGAPPRERSSNPVRHSIHTSTTPTAYASDRSVDPYAALDSWSGAGGTPLRGRGPRTETAGLPELPAPPPDYQEALRSSGFIEGQGQAHTRPRQHSGATLSGRHSLPARVPAKPFGAAQGAHQVQDGDHHRTPDLERQGSHRGAAVVGGTSAVQRRQSVEDPLSALGRYDLVFLVDDSPSMDADGLWQVLRTALMGVVEKSAKYDKDGIDVVFMNDETAEVRGVKDSVEVAQVFDRVVPSGSTPTGMRLDDLLRPYIDMCEDAKASRTSGGPKIDMPKPCILVIVTDGRADDPESLKDTIVEFAGRLDDIRAPPFQLGIQFLQIGTDPDASAFLRELDDDIKREASVRDMVDTVAFPGRFTSDFILQVLLGSVNRRIDDRH